MSLHRMLYVALFILYLLHNDFWLWHKADIVLGLPVGLTYHLGFCFISAGVFYISVKTAWPAELASAEEQQ